MQDMNVIKLSSSQLSRQFSNTGNISDAAGSAHPATMASRRVVAVGFLLRKGVARRRTSHYGRLIAEEETASVFTYFEPSETANARQLTIRIFYSQ
jgi:hypothetical protein